MPFRVLAQFIALALLKVLGVKSRIMSKTELLIDKLGVYAERFEQIFESKFERVARDPRFLAFIGRSLNYASAIRLETRKLETEVASLRARAKLALVKNHKARPKAEP